jgi:formylglycine-generating enzyme required for sulfatase activity
VRHAISLIVMVSFGLAAVQTSPVRAEDEPAPGAVFRECPNFCPEMVGGPAGEFMMGSPPEEKNRSDSEGPQRKVTIARPFAKYEATFAEWEACVAGGGCTSNPSPSHEGWGKGRRPVIHVSWHDAKEFVAWLSSKTDKELPAAQRGGVGVRSAGEHHDTLCPW